LTIYANPADDKVIMDVPQPGNVAVRLFNPEGRQVKRVEGEDDVIVDMQHEVSGIYLLRISYRNKQYHYKLLKQ